MHMGAAAAAVAVTWLLLSAARAPWRCAGQALVPGVIIFGDSVVDAGNNNRLPTLVRADFPPYGRDFPTTHAPTGRFCNGKLATDYTVENLGFSSYPPAYLSQEAQSDNRTLLHGANFASGASGYLDATAALYGAISLSRQLDYFREFQSKVAAAAGGAKAAALTAGSIYVVSAGTSDYVQNYYVNPVFSATYTPDQFADALMQPFTSFVECERELPSGGAAAGLLVVATDVGLLGVPGGEHGVGPMEACGGSTRVSWVCSGLRLLRHAESTARRTISAIIAAIKGLYGLGARRIGVTSLPPTGCLPASITLFGGGGGGGCVERLNNDSLAFNKKLEAASDAVRKRHPDLKLVVFDIYTPLLDLVSNPTNAGFFEPRRACCGTGTIETSLLCNQGTPGTCANATGYVFWDGFHPTDAANKVLADALLLQGLQLIS